MDETSGVVPRFQGGPDGWSPPMEYYPVSLGANLIADPRTMLIVREILATALPRVDWCGFARGARSPGSRSEYRLTPSGLALRHVLGASGAWVRDWQFPKTAAGEVSVATLIWHVYQGSSPRCCLYPSSPSRSASGTRSSLAPGFMWVVMDRARQSECPRRPDLTVGRSPGACGRGRNYAATARRSVQACSWRHSVRISPCRPRRWRRRRRSR